MGKDRSIIYILFFLFGLVSVSAQTLTGIVLDEKTNRPIESAAVYFDGTSIGTSTRASGEFKIKLVQGVTSPLIISYMGYQKTIFSDYAPGKFYKVLMAEDVNTLDEVFISADDGFPRAIKLQQFRKEFLGKSENGLSCKILNENDLILRFDAERSRLTVSSKKPVQIVNENLRYSIAFDIDDFVINYQYVDLLNRWFGASTVAYQGTSFYSDLDATNKRKTLKRRDQVYQGSVLHFMRALSQERLKEESYRLIKGGLIVPVNEFITITPVENSTNVLVRVTERIHILYKKTRQSIMEVRDDSFMIDQFGNHSPITNVLFGGEMGDQRIGDSLPLDYELKGNK